jgi:thiamine pyrophosphokinase
MRAVIFANGVVHSDAFLSDWIQLDDVIIAADGGLQHCQRLGIHPAVVIGDLDSADPHALDWAKANNARVIHYPPAKNETDLELALMYAIDQGLQQIRIVGALGGRTDHAIANLLLLSQFDDPQLDIRFEDGIEEVFFIRNQSVIDGLAEDLVSLLPFDKRNVMGVTTDGLAYPLKDDTLTYGKTRGVSNVMLGAHAKVGIQLGLLLCIHTRITKRGKNE